MPAPEREIKESDATVEMVSRKHGPTLHDVEKAVFVAWVKDAVTKVMNDYASRQSPVYAEKVGIALASEITGYSKNSLSPMHSKGRIPGAMMVGERLLFDTIMLRDSVSLVGIRSRDSTYETVPRKTLEFRSRG